MQESARYDVGVIRLPVLKYAYYLCNQYFHVERWLADFLVETHNGREMRFSAPYSSPCAWTLSSR